MPPRKKNLWSSVDISKLEKEISDTIEYLESIEVFSLIDDVNFDAIPKPQVISTIEKQIFTALKAIQSCSNIALALFDKHGMNDFIGHLMNVTIECLKDIQKYYEQKPIKKTTHRYATGEKYNKKGVPYNVSILTSSKEDQISNRIMINEKILTILPIIEQLENVKNIALSKGDKEIPESMENYD